MRRAMSIRTPAVDVRWLEVGAAVGLSALASVTLAATGDWRVVLGLFAGAGFVAAGMLRPALFVSVFVLVRPLLDAYSHIEFGGVPSANAAGVLGLALFPVFAVYLVGAPRFFTPRAAWPLVAILALSVVASVHAWVDFGGEIGARPLGELARLGALLAIYFLAANLFTTSTSVSRLFLLVGLSGVVPAVFGLIEWVQGVEPLPGQDLGRIGGTFTGPLTLGTYLAICVLILVSLPRKVLGPWIRFGAIAVMVAAMVGTYGRQGWVLLLFGIVVLGWRERKRHILAAAAVLVVLILTVPGVAERALPSSSTASDAATYGSYEWRIDTWRALLDKYSEEPLIGYGLETETLVNPRIASTGEGYGSHNTLVSALINGGILMLIAYLALFWVLIRTLLPIARDRWELQPYARVVLALWGGVILLAFTTDDALAFTAAIYAVLALTGSIEGAHGRSRAAQQEHEPRAPARVRDSPRSGAHALA